MKRIKNVTVMNGKGEKNKRKKVIVLKYNKLETYNKYILQITNPEGPDTGTWSMHTVGWLELGNETRAQQSFGMMRRNINEPFKVGNSCLFFPIKAYFYHARSVLSTSLFFKWRS